MPLITKQKMLKVFLEGKIIELENTIKNSSIVSIDKNSDKILIGSTVIVLMNGEKNEYQIVDGIESESFKIINCLLESPIGKSYL